MNIDKIMIPDLRAYLAGYDACMDLYEADGMDLEQPVVPDYRGYSPALAEAFSAGWRRAYTLTLG